MDRRERIDLALAIGRVPEPDTDDPGVREQYFAQRSEAAWRLALDVADPDESARLLGAAKDFNHRARLAARQSRSDA